jgi:hypothetical protein
MLAHRAAALRADAAAPALQAAHASLQAHLSLAGPPPEAPPVPAPQALPEAPPADNPLPWLQRRLQVAAHDGYRVGCAARVLLQALRR